MRERRGNNQNWEESKKKMGDLELGSIKGGEYGGKGGENRNVKNEDERMDCVVDFYGV